MRKTVSRIALVLLAVLLVLSFVACNRVDKTGAWESATYRHDKSFGKGEITFELEVIAEEQSVTFTVSTDKDNLADALLEHGLVEGEDSGYGLYIKKVNGILADYSVDATYWKLSQDGKAFDVGASSVTPENGAHYEFEKTK